MRYRLKVFGGVALCIFGGSAMSQGLEESKGGGDIRRAYINGETFQGKEVYFENVDGLGIFEGDIILGNTSSIDADSPVSESVVISGDGFRWPENNMPYTIDPSLSSQSLSDVERAIDHWVAKTHVSFVRVTPTNSSSYPNFVNFTNSTGCSSFVGMQGGKQNINLNSRCGFGSTVHEIGHAFGLWHEQSREDRDAFVAINFDNIQSGREHNFNQRISDGDDVGGYDYGSIMHYGATAFSRNGNPTIVPLNPRNATIGQRNGLSSGDISAVNKIYPELNPNIIEVGFDAKFYLSLYPDLRRAFGANYKAALNHWKVNGIKEGRRASRVFDVRFYLYRYQDLAKAFGTDYQSAFNHWKKHGIKEGRRSAREFDVKYYLSQYGDLRKAYGENYTLALNHWLNHGMVEGRRGALEFHSKNYLNRYSDLRKAYGESYKSAIDHWTKHGVQEGRQGSNDFNVKAYLNRYGDLRKAFGENYKATQDHWIRYGQAEGRIGN